MASCGSIDHCCIIHEILALYHSMNEFDTKQESNLYHSMNEFVLVYWSLSCLLFKCLPCVLFSLDPLKVFHRFDNLISLIELLSHD